MDFSIFDHPDHMTALCWLGHRDWMTYRDFPEKRAIGAKPLKLHIKPKEDVKDGIVITEKEYNKYPSEMWRVIKEIFDVLEYDVVGTLWYHTLSRSLAGGPKIFKPTAKQCEALENAEARYSFKDYHQPFPVIILEIPEEYRNELQKNHGIDAAPKFVLVSHDEKNRFINVSAFYKKDSIITHITPDREEYVYIEDSLVKNRNRRQDSGKTVEAEASGEFDAAETVQRLGINFAMMMSLYTVKVSGPVDPNNYRIWINDARGRRKDGQPTNRAIAAQQKLVAAMQLLQFDQNVEFYDEIEERIEVAQNVDIENLHRSPKSHWRRGHFAMQAYGEGRRDRKMIFRKPLLVRAQYFLGEMKDASATYTIKPNRN